MPSKQASNVGLNYNWGLGESGWNEQMDENLTAIDALLCLNVLSATTVTPPIAPNEGDRFLVPAGATGQWLTQIGNIARYNDSAWEFFSPKPTWGVRAADDGQDYWFDGVNWITPASLLGQYADDSAANTGGVPVMGMYVNSSTGALTIRLT